MISGSDFCPDIRVLEERHMISALLYIRDHEGCMNSDRYRNIIRSTRFPDKLSLLELSGLIRVDGGRVTSIHLTDKGRIIAEYLYEMQALMADTKT